MSIPKKIHYCWFGGNKLPDLALRCMNSWEKNCPDFEVIEWNEKNYFGTSDYYNNAMKRKLWAFASDYARLEFLYTHGGVYLDTDVELIRPIDDLMMTNGFVAFESECWVAAGVIASTPKNEIFLKCLKIMDDYHENTGGFINIPKALTMVLGLFGDVRVNANVNGIELLDSDSFYPYNPYDKTRGYKGLMFADITIRTYGIHHYEKSWQQSIKKQLTTLLRNKYRRLLGKPVAEVY